MLSRLRFGDGIDYVVERARKGNQKAMQDLEEMVYPENSMFWNAYVYLSSSRNSGMSAGSIPISEINAYCELISMKDADQRLRLAKAIQSMDSAHLKWSKEHGRT